jgi:hypothetical protein
MLMTGHEKREVTSCEETKKTNRILNWVEAALLGVFGPFFIGLTEYSIRESKVDISADLTQSSGQLIPFVGGVMGVGLILWALIKKAVFGCQGRNGIKY